MLWKRTVALAGLLLLLALIGSAFVLTLAASGECHFNHRSLLAAPASQIEQQARDYACAQLQGGDNIQTLLYRPITPDEALSLFPGTGAFCRDQKLALVVFKGDFVSQGGFIAEPPHFAYVMLLMDLKSGAPTVVEGRANGEGLETILHSSVLPTEAPRSIPEIAGDVLAGLNLPAPLPPPGISSDCLPDNYVAPTARPPH